MKFRPSCVSIIVLAMVAVARAAPSELELIESKPAQSNLVTGKVNVGYDYFEVVGAGPLGRVINAAVARALDIPGGRAHAYAQAKDPAVATAVVEGGCVPGLLTRRTVSWRCGVGVVNIAVHDEPGSGGGGSTDHPWRVENYRVDGLTLVPLEVSSLFARGTDVTVLLSRAAGAPVSQSMLKEMMVTEAGLEYVASGEGGRDYEAGVVQRVAIPVAAFAAHLAPGSPWAGLEDVPLPDTAPDRAAPRDADRFVVRDGHVTDQMTQLVWRQTDNATDIAWADADAYCRALGVGPRGSWRLPRASELEALTSGSMRHKPAEAARDCAKGKYAYLIPRVFQVTCGLLWSSSISGSTAADQGLVSGKSRTAAVTAKKNHRALCVSGR